MHKSVLKWKVYQEQTDAMIKQSKDGVVWLYHKVVGVPKERYEDAGSSVSAQLIEKVKKCWEKTIVLLAKAAPWIEKYYLGTEVEDAEPIQDVVRARSSPQTPQPRESSALPRPSTPNIFRR